MKTFSSRARLAALPLALTTAFPSFAQSRETPQLQEVVVTATRSTQLLSATLAHTTVITREDIKRSQATDLITLLQREAGLQRTQNGGIGTVSSIFMRGAPSLETLVLIDGVPQNKQDASGSVSLEHVMLDNVERVEIVRGNVSAIYGSGAIGGVIQIFTKTGTREPSAGLSVEIGPRAFRRLSGSISASAGDTTISVAASRITTDGFSAINTAQYPSANPDADGYKNTSVNLSLIHKLSNDHNFGARLMQSTGDTAYDNAFGAPTDIQTATTRLNQTTLFTDNTWGNWRSRLSLGEQSDKSVIRDNGVFGSDNGFTTRATVLNWVNTVALGGDWLVTAGLEEQHQRVDTTTTSTIPTYDRTRNTSAVFTGLEGKVGNGGLQINLRHDEVGGLRKNTAYLGYGYPLTDQFKVIASVSTAFNAPPLGYLFAPGFGNPALRPELARSKELGVQYEQGAHLLRATYFDTRVKDQLNFDLTTFAFANIDRSRNSGVELSYKGSIGSTDLRASLTAQDPINELTGQTLSRRARGLLSFGASHPVGAWRLDADLRYSGKRPDAYTDDPVTFGTVNTTLAAYSVLDLAVSYKLSPEVMLKGRLDNVTDRKYQTVFGYNQQPRGLYVGLTWTPRM